MKRMIRITLTVFILLFILSICSAARNDSEVSMAKQSGLESSAVIQYLRNSVPEIDAYSDVLKRNGKSYLIMQIEKEPDANASDGYERDYYSVYVGESFPDRTVRWETFFVHKDLNNILHRDTRWRVETVEEWRSRKDYS